MNREFIDNLGFAKETIDELMREYGKLINGYKERADKVDGLEAQIEDYKQQIEQRDEQLEELKNVDEDSWKEKVDELQQINEQTKQEYEQKLEKQAFEFALERAIAESGARNAKAVKALIDSKSIEFDGKELKGLDDQLKGLQESDPYLFGSDEPAGLKGRKPNDSPEPPQQNTLEDEYKKAMEQGDTATAIAIKNQMFEEQKNNNQE